MAPDRNLAMYTATQVNKTIAFWNGYCPVHNSLTPEDVRRAKEAYPYALFLAHPECPPKVLELADGVFSTSGMLRYVAESPHETFIIGTESGILYPMQKHNPHKRFYPASPTLVCPEMKKISLADVLTALETLEPRIGVPEEIRVNARKAIERMLAIG